MTSKQAGNRSIQQKRAHFALTTVQAVVEKQGGDVAGRFKAYSNSLPAMIQINGIGQALAFAYQKSNGGKGAEASAWSALLDAITRWLMDHRIIYNGPSKPAELLNALTGGDQAHYQLAQAEAQALLSWIKDFARAEIQSDDTGQEG